MPAEATRKPLAAPVTVDVRADPGPSTNDLAKLAAI